MQLRSSKQVLVGLCIGFCAGSLKGGELVEDFTSVTEQSPIVRPQPLWSNPSGRTWSFQQNEEGKVALISSPNITEGFHNEGRVHFSLLEAPTPVRKISIKLAIDQIGNITESMRSRPPRLLISLVNRPGVEGLRERAAAVSVSLPEASDDPSLLERMEVALVVDRAAQEGSGAETRVSIPEPVSLNKLETLSIEFSEDGNQARIMVGEGPQSDWIDLAFPASEIGYLRISQLGLRITIEEIRIQ
jgi:hypothetical protein